MGNAQDSSNKTLSNNDYSVDNDYNNYNDYYDYDYDYDTARTIQIIDYTFTPVVILFGLFGNILSLAVMSMKKNRRTATGVYMGILAVVDTLQMITLIVYFAVETIGKLNIAGSSVYCKCFLTFSTYFSELSIYILVTMTIDRTLALKLPSKKSWRKPKKIAIIVSIVSLVVLVRMVPVMLYSSSEYSITLNREVCMLYLTISQQNLSWLEIVFETILPFIILMVCNTIIIHTLCMVKVGPADQPSVMPGLQKERQKFVTVILLIVSFTELLLTSPINILLIVTVGTKWDNTMNIIFEIFLRLFYMNNAVNFYVCLIGASKFRGDVRKLWKAFRSLHCPVDCPRLCG